MIDPIQREYEEAQWSWTHLTPRCCSPAGSSGGRTWLSGSGGWCGRSSTGSGSSWPPSWGRRSPADEGGKRDELSFSPLGGAAGHKPHPLPSTLFPWLRPPNGVTDETTSTCRARLENMELWWHVTVKLNVVASMMLDTWCDVQKSSGCFVAIFKGSDATVAAARRGQVWLWEGFKINTQGGSAVRWLNLL